MVVWDSVWSFSISYGVVPPQPQPEEGLGMLLLLGLGALLVLSEREKARGGK